jgi:VIT1/CCC1 family predicted Fe2+/Mn2+ transporter
LEADPEGELQELAEIYVARGLSAALAMDVAKELTEHDVLQAHARDELGITDLSKARPVQAALASAATFSTGAALPLAAVVFAPLSAIIWVTTAASVLVLGTLGYVSAKTGGAPVGRAVARVALWGVAAMAATAGVGRLFDVAMG